MSSSPPGFGVFLTGRIGYGRDVEKKPPPHEEFARRRGF
jgi:hypothetical protein